MALLLCLVVQRFGFQTAARHSEQQRQSMPAIMVWQVTPVQDNFQAAEAQAELAPMHLAQVV
jgi:hypothetical protein